MKSKIIVRERMNKLQIYFLLTFIMLFWGLNVVALKVLVTHFNPFMMTSIRIFIAGFSILIILALSKKLHIPKPFLWKWLILTSILGVVIHHLLLSIGLTKTSAVNASIILGFSPLLTAILSLVFRFNTFNMLSFIGFLIGNVGVTLAVLNDHTSELTFTSGSVLIFLSILSQSFSFLLIKKISATIDSLSLTGYILSIGSIILLIISLVIAPESFQQMLHAPLYLYVILFASSFLATAVGHVAYNFAISKIGPSETAIFGNLNTLFALIGASIFLNENISLQQLLGCLCIIIGIFFGTGIIERQLLRFKRRNS